jgi:hypothetical protein
LRRRHLPFEARARATAAAVSRAERPNYSAFAHDACSTTPQERQRRYDANHVHADCSLYPDGSLNGNNDERSATDILQAPQGSRRSANVQAIKSVTCSGSGGLIWAQARVNGEVRPTLWSQVDDAVGNNLLAGMARKHCEVASGTGLAPSVNSGRIPHVKINTNTDMDEFTSTAFLGNAEPQAHRAATCRPEVRATENSPPATTYFDDSDRPPDVTPRDP